MCALSAKRNNKPLADFVERMSAAGKPPKVILIAVARKLLVYAHAVIRTQKAFTPSPEHLYPLDLQHGISAVVPPAAQAEP